MARLGFGGGPGAMGSTEIWGSCVGTVGSVILDPKSLAFDTHVDDRVGFFAAGIGALGDLERWGGCV